ncbi:MAG: glycosyltransferase, partial [Pseudomonadota bacterium]
MSINLGIITEQLENYGGSEIYLLECLKRWQEELDITLYTSRFNPELFDEYGIDPDRVHVQLLPETVNTKHRFELFDNLVIRPRIWERYIGQHQLYFQYLFPSQFVRRSPSVWFAAEPLRMLYDLQHHDSANESSISFHIYPRMRYEEADNSDLNVTLQMLQEVDRQTEIETLATNSKMMAGYLKTIYGREADMVAYPGINLPESWSGPVNNRTALFVGRLWDHKRVDLIINALSKVPDGKLFIVGEGPEKPKLKALTKSLGLEKNVTFWGALSTNALNALYRSVTCGIYTPVREPFGIMPLEAASYGMPVVVTQDGGYTEVLDESCARIVAPDPGQIALALNTLFSNFDVAVSMGKAARECVERYTWDHTARDLLTLFNRTLESRNDTTFSKPNRPLLGAHYYPWYNTGEDTRHWNENSDYAAVADLPVTGEYSSDDDDLILRHLETVQAAGLDYLVLNMQVSFNGLDPRDIRAVEKFFALAAEHSPNLSICFMLAFDKVSSENIDQVFSYLESRFTTKSNYLIVRDKPVIWYFLTESFIGHFYHHFEQFKTASSAYIRIAAANFCYSKYLSVHYSDFFHGWSIYSPLQISNKKRWEALWSTSHIDFAENCKSDLVGAFTICPGYNDTALTLTERGNSKFRKISRKNTLTYERMQNACMKLDPLPELIVVTSFNEFHERTHIEPTERTGELYVNATRKFSETLKSS